jgi:threonine/homoserine/homoserine lactone efflux protein
MDVLAMSAYGLAGGALAARFRDRGFRRGFSAFVGVLLLLAAILIALRL